MSDTETAADTLHPRRPIIIVDDEEPILLAIDTTLRMAGINNLITCGDSRRVLGLLSEQRIDVMLLDLKMPGKVCSRSWNADQRNSRGLKWAIVLK